MDRVLEKQKRNMIFLDTGIIWNITFLSLNYSSLWFSNMGDFKSIQEKIGSDFKQVLKDQDWEEAW